MKIICIGDSLTYGYGVGFGECWVDLLRKSIKQEVINFGTNGDTSGYMLDRTKRNVLPNYAEDGDIAIVMGGANDVLMYGSIKYSSENILEIAELLEEKGLTTVVGIEPGFYHNDYPFFGPLDVEKLNEKYSIFCEEVIGDCLKKNIKYFDLRELFIGKDNLFSDGVHPTVEGHRMIFDRIRAIIE